MLSRYTFLFTAVCCSTLHAADRPNILWLSTEDMSPMLGCYGDEQARTPNIDKLAAEGVLFENAFVPNPVCATCRSSIITGVYSVSLGTHHMRSRVKLPAEIRCFPEYLREVGYYCTNNSKEDYNFRTPPTVWDQSSGKAHWRNRPKDASPFFAVFNFVGTHESAIRGDEPKYSQVTSVLKPEDRHDPGKLTLPPYYPDTPKVREHWARAYNVVTALDYWIADRLRELDEAGLAEDTIVFFWSDHGSGIPRGKRWLYDSGLHVPLIVRVPEKWRGLAATQLGERRDELVSLLDLGPTVLHLAGENAPEYMQGQRFLGSELPAPRETIFAARDRMDESYDMARAVRDKRYKYIRNYMPWRPYAQTNSYGDNNTIMQEWRRAAREGELNAAQKTFMAASKAPEELYDLEADPFEVNNLAGDEKLESVREKLSGELDSWIAEVRDLGVVPEGTLTRLVPRGSSRFELFRHVFDEAAYQQVAEAANEGPREQVAALRTLSKKQNNLDDDSLRVMQAELQLTAAEGRESQRTDAIATLLDIYSNGDTNWDQVAAACVLDRHLDMAMRYGGLAKANRKAAKSIEGERRNMETGVTSLRPWVGHFHSSTRKAQKTPVD